MKRKLIRLTEGDLHRIVKESVKRILKEARDNSIDDEEWEDIDNAYDKSGLWHDNPSLDKEDDMDKMFSDVEYDPSEEDKWLDNLHTDFEIGNPNIEDKSKRYHPYRNYIARNSEKYTSPEETQRLRRPELGKGLNGSGDYLDIWKGHNGIK
jgi:hypothetical protein